MKPILLVLIRLAGKWWCRLHGANVHPTAKIHGFPKITIKPGGSIRIGPHATINAAGWSNPHNDGRRTVLFAAPSATLEIHENAGISSSRIIAWKHITIGKNTLIGAGSLICDSDMHEVPLGSSNPIRISPIHIGHSVFIGTNSTILKGVTLGENAVIGAGAVVTNDVPPLTLAAGNPARHLRSLDLQT
jgi:acetyltransferase-like isoleucine patch superfamily enzyme